MRSAVAARRDGGFVCTSWAPSRIFFEGGIVSARSTYLTIRFISRGVSRRSGRVEVNRHQRACLRRACRFCTHFVVRRGNAVFSRSSGRVVDRLSRAQLWGRWPIPPALEPSECPLTSLMPLILLYFLQGASVFRKRRCGGGCSVVRRQAEVGRR